MNLQAKLEEAIQIAAAAHGGQRDKADEPYVLHPLRVMLRQREPAAKIVGVLHDVVEDCEGWTFERLSALGFGPEVLEPLKLVTKLPGEDTKSIEGYLEFVRRCASNLTASAVKLADIEDNMDLTRIKTPSESDLKRMERYEAGRKFLLENTAAAEAIRPRIG